MEWDNTYKFHPNSTLLSREGLNGRESEALVFGFWSLALNSSQYIRKPRFQNRHCHSRPNLKCYNWKIHKCCRFCCRSWHWPKFREENYAIGDIRRCRIILSAYKFDNIYYIASKTKSCSISGYEKDSINMWWHREIEESTLPILSTNWITVFQQLLMTRLAKIFLILKYKILKNKSCGVTPSHNWPAIETERIKAYFIDYIYDGRERSYRCKFYWINIFKMIHCLH